ncbi:hypothetical protein SO802_015451 [Lithocarpus litseifolius]|uniref:Amino acid transporter transmembrane domain-containing protein n=1 Tax=Lithocarpus litseifolius TaxID=425828 RepID=A0AAW2CX09_9ROSI
MALPAAMKELGLGLGIGMIVFLAILTEGSLEMLLRFRRVGNSHSYGEVMRDAFGRAGRLLLQICILVNNVGTLIVYMIIIGVEVVGGGDNGNGCCGYGGGFVGFVLGWQWLGVGVGVGLLGLRIGGIASEKERHGGSG